MEKTGVSDRFGDNITEDLFQSGYTKNIKIKTSNKGKGAGNMAAMNMNTEMFREMMREGETVLVDFWAPWCTYCRRISSAYDKIAEQYGGKLKVAKINIDEEGALADEEQIEVIPTLVLYRNGKAVGSVVAPDSKAAIEAFISENL